MGGRHFPLFALGFAEAAAAGAPATHGGGRRGDGRLVGLDPEVVLDGVVGIYGCGLWG